MRQMKVNGILNWMAVVAGALLLVGCSKPPSQGTSPVTPAAAQPTPAPAPVVSAPVPAVSAPAPAVGAAAATPSTEGVVIPPSALAQDTQNAEAAQQIADMELAYHSSTDFSTRIDAMYRISDLNSADAVSALGRLFDFEKDPELKTEILDALSDVEGQDAGKVAILAAAAGTDQAKDVRQSAIDGLTNIDPQRALPILQGMVTDSDSDISDAAKDAVEQVKANMTASQ
jgi:HEAT repeat protein